MPTEKQPDPIHDDAASVSRDAWNWSAQFIKFLKIEFDDSVGSAPETMYPTDKLRQLMTHSFVRTLIESGATPESAYDLLDAARMGILGNLDDDWNEQKNERRIVLIDKSIQGDLDPQEKFELIQLTEQMRSAFDTEEFLPIEGAHNMIKTMLHLDQSKGNPD